MREPPPPLAALLDGAPSEEQDWLRAYYASASAEVLALAPVECWRAGAAAHRRFAAEPPPESGHVRLEPSGLAGYERLLSVCPDRPFLVDTLQLVLRRAGARVLAVVHPLLPLKREGGQVLIEPQAPRESLVQMLFAPPDDPALKAALQPRLQQALEDVRQVVADFAAMRDATVELAAHLRSNEAPQDALEREETAAFLDWLIDGHFTFVGVARTLLTERAEGAGFVMAPHGALGLARPGRCLADTDALIAPRAELDKYAESTRLVVVTQALQRAPVHHDEYLDVISVKRFEHGRLVGTLRLIGLFTTDVFVERPRHIPLLRMRVKRVLARAGFSEESHAGKQLRDTLALLPRDELWQSSDEELYALATGVRALREGLQLRLFLRRDRYGRFFSALIYLPRERYGRELRDRLVEALRSALGGTSADRSVEFPRGGQHARLQVRISTPPGTPAPADVAALEAQLRALTRTWEERLREALRAIPEGERWTARYAQAFDRSFTDATPAEAALADIAVLDQLSEAQPRRLRLLPPQPGAGAFSELRLYTREAPTALSAVLPQLEHFGLGVIGQDPSEVRPADGPVCWVQTFTLRPVPVDGDAAAQALRFEAAFHAMLRGEIEDDRLNQLVLFGGLDAREVVVLRVLVRYLIQTGLPYSQAFLEQPFVDHPLLARQLVSSFCSRHDPALDAGQREAGYSAAVEAVRKGLDAVPSLDADRVLRTALAVVTASLRSNYFLDRPIVSIKLDPKGIPELPLPRPMFEIFVYSPRVEGVHLRGGRVARGGLRWSDRPQDFRTEVLGLMKAQQVKNAIIVPVGAKGGFVVKQGDRSDREAWMRAGREAYVEFLSGLLDLTDNRVGENLVPPRGVVCHDSPDPYLVVAADKGTATFSDLANETAAGYGFWLGDAFASGGSQGYDHKKMGITARGAWESVKRHFRERGHDIQQQPFTVIGIGDMSGDVFGNGMLLSRQIRLLAAFDHRHIFIDPDPDAARSFAERERLFALPRSSWADYDVALLSPGGGVWPRTEKRIPLTPQVQALLETEETALSPQALIHRLLQVPADLLWNGGIGTYVKASHESHAEVGDRANDALRIDARDLRVRVVGEGGNLGLTQAARIEYALSGGAINTDAIDNAGGVHSSDREVNIKIPLNRLMQDGQLDRATRDPLLVAMTEDLVRAVLRDSQVQSGALTLMSSDGEARIDEYQHLLRMLEREGRIDRAVDGLPDEEALKERRRRGQGLTRPELAVLLAYTKITLFDDLVASRVVDDPWFTSDLLAYFPPALVRGYRPALEGHQLRREIIATILANGLCNRMGAPFAHRIGAELGVGRAAAVHAWAAAHAMIDGDRYWQWLDAEPPRHSAAQHRVVSQRVAGLLKHLCRSLLVQRGERLEIGPLNERYRPWMAHFDSDAATAALPPRYREDHERAVAAHREEGFIDAEAEALARLRVLGVVPDLVHLGESSGRDVPEIATAYFALGEQFDLPWLHAQINALKVSGRWPALARANLRDDLFRIQALLVARVLRPSKAGTAVASALAAWQEAEAERIRFVQRRLDALRGDSGDDFMRLVVAARELYRLC